MKIRLRENSFDLEDELKNLIPLIVKSAQKEYHSWDESDIDTYANGGICHFIADEIAGVCSKLDNVFITTHSYSHVQHVVTVVGRLTDIEDADSDEEPYEKECYIVDIPYYYYEEGGGFSWTKIPDVEFDESMVIIQQVNFDDFFNEDGEPYDN